MSKRIALTLMLFMVLVSMSVGEQLRLSSKLGPSDAASDHYIHQILKIDNVSSEVINLDTVDIAYYLYESTYPIDFFSADNIWCGLNGSTISSSNVTVSFVALETPYTEGSKKADKKVVFDFNSSITISPGQYVEVQFSVKCVENSANGEVWYTLNETDDWSYASNTSYATNSGVAVVGENTGVLSGVLPPTDSRPSTHITVTLKDEFLVAAPGSPLELTASLSEYPEGATIVYFWGTPKGVVQTSNPTYFDESLSNDEAGVYNVEAKINNATTYVPAQTSVVVVDVLNKREIIKVGNGYSNKVEVHGLGSSLTSESKWSDVNGLIEGMENELSYPVVLPTHAQKYSVEVIVTSSKTGIQKSLSFLDIDLIVYEHESDIATFSSKSATLGLKTYGRVNGLTFSWEKGTSIVDLQPMVGVSDALLDIQGTPENAGLYKMSITDAVSSSTVSETTNLVVISSFPSDDLVEVGGTFAASLTTAGGILPEVKWYRIEGITSEIVDSENGFQISEDKVDLNTINSLTLVNADITKAGSYYVEFKNNGIKLYQTTFDITVVEDASGYQYPKVCGKDQDMKVDGKVTIGNVTNPTEQLEVAGNIKCEELKIGTWTLRVPDYVFKSDYKLPPLSHVEKYINANSHLPEVPSEATIKENGISIAEFNMLLLRKIEELTLYTIEQEKKIEELQKSVQNSAPVQ